MPQEEDNPHFLFSKKERLCSKKEIEKLLHANNTCFVYPFKCYFLFSDSTSEDFENQLVITVPKRIFKHAVDRNRVKRLIREAYRLNKNSILRSATSQQKRKVNLLILFVGKEIPDFSYMQEKICALLNNVALKSIPY